MIYIQGTSLVSKGRDKEITTAIRRLGIFREADIRLSISFSREKKKVSKFPRSEHMRQERVNRETYERTNERTTRTITMRVQFQHAIEEEGEGSRSSGIEKRE